MYAMSTSARDCWNEMMPSNSMHRSRTKSPTVFLNILIRCNGIPKGNFKGILILALSHRFAIIMCILARFPLATDTDSWRMGHRTEVVNRLYSSTIHWLPQSILPTVVVWLASQTMSILSPMSNIRRHMTRTKPSTYQLTRIWETQKYHTDLAIGRTYMPAQGRKPIPREGT